jgi:LPS sulfotransferase NodH
MSAEETIPFIILTSPRSGSTWLVSLLNQMEDTTAYGELFLPRKRSGKWDADFAHPRFVEVRKADRLNRPAEVFKYLDTLYQQPGAVGFKLMYSHLRRYPEMLAYFLVHRVRVVHLVRKNPLDILISRAVKRKLEQAHRLANEPAVEGVQVELNTETLIKKLQIKQRKMDRARNLLRLSGLRQIEIGYEELQKDPSVFPGLCRFLSIQTDGTMPVSKFQKVRRDSQVKVLKNYGEVRQVLDGTRYLVYLEQG